MTADLIVALQQGLPLVQRPFAALGAASGMAGHDVLAQVAELFAQGTARRLGAVFDARLLGYKSTLCALLVPPDELDAVAARITPHAGVTHCYLRGWPDELDPNLPGGPCGDALPNLWFTLAEHTRKFDAALERLCHAVAPHVILDLPARRRFKIDVIFDPATRERSERIPKSDRSDRSDQSDQSDQQEADKSQTCFRPVRIA